MKIARALISVSNKKGIAAFARELERQGVDIISTGGTAELLRKSKIPVREISNFTSFPEVLEGRVKTLHPRVHVPGRVGAVYRITQNEYPFHLRVVGRDARRSGIPVHVNRAGFADRSMFGTRLKMGMFDCKRPVVPLIQAMKERNVEVGRLFPALPNHMVSSKSFLSSPVSFGFVSANAFTAL